MYRPDMCKVWDHLDVVLNAAVPASMAVRTAALLQVAQHHPKHLAGQVAPAPPASQAVVVTTKRQTQLAQHNGLYADFCQPVASRLLS